MKETVERNNRFYTNEKGEIKTENEQLKEWLIIANKENERLKEENTILKQTMSNNSLLINENALLKSIINKAIEYIEEWQGFPHTNGTTHEELRNLKTILLGVDKE